MIMPNHYIARANFSMKKKTERLEWLRVVIDKKIMKLLEKNPYEYIYKIANEVNATFKQCAYRIKKIN